MLAHGGSLLNIRFSFYVVNAFARRNVMDLGKYTGHAAPHHTGLPSGSGTCTLSLRAGVHLRGFLERAPFGL